MDADARDVIDINTPAPIVRAGASTFYGLFWWWTGRIAVCEWNGAWKSIGVFKYRRGRRSLFKGVLLGARKYAIRTRGSQILLRGPYWKLRVDYERQSFRIGFRWSWRGEECSLDKSWKWRAGELKLRIGDREYVVNPSAPAVVFPMKSFDQRIIASPPRAGELGEFIQPRPEKMDRAQLFQILLMSLMVRSYFEESD
jgi:hypothetical protein